MDWGRAWNTGPTADVDRWLHSLADDVRAMLQGVDGGAILSAVPGNPGAILE